MADQEEKPISETVPGGAYQSADGSWHNAKGKKIPTPAFAKPGKKAAPSSAAEPKQDLESLSVKELKEIAKERGLENFESLKKAELLELLSAPQE